MKTNAQMDAMNTQFCLKCLTARPRWRFAGTGFSWCNACLCKEGHRPAVLIADDVEEEVAPLSPEKQSQFDEIMFGTTKENETPEEKMNKKRDDLLWNGSS